MNKKKFAVWLISVILLSISAILLIFSLFCKNFIGNGSEVPKNPVKSRVSEVDFADKRGISSVVENSLKNEDILAKTKNPEENVKEPPMEDEDEKIQLEGWTTSSLNVRKQPNTESDVLDVLPFNTYIRYYEYDDEWAEIAFDDGHAYVNRNYISDEECSFIMYNIPEYYGFKSWMSYKAITNKSSRQYKLQQIASTGYAGVRVVNDRFCVAIGTAFGTEIGTYIDLILENGTIIPCIVGDVKDPKHTDSSNVFTIVTKNKKTYCCSEFIVNTKQLDKNAAKAGDISYADDNWDSPVVSIIVYDKNIFEKGE